jgi:protein-tyrosine phosphatase
MSKYSKLTNEIKISLTVPIQKLCKNIYVGNLLGSIDYKLLKDNNIKRVVQIIEYSETPFQDNILYLPIVIEDSNESDISIFFDEFIKFTNCEENVFIHCQHGSSRTGAFSIVYLMVNYNMSFQEALNFARDVRPCINPNTGFKEQILTWFNNK